MTAQAAGEPRTKEDWEASESERRRKRESENFARAPWADSKVPFWARLLGARKGSHWDGFQHGKATFRARYGETTVGRTGWAFALGRYDSPHLHVSVPGISVFFHLPPWKWLVHITRGGFGDGRSYGFSSCDGSVHLRWGRKYKIINRPWGWARRRSDYRREYLDINGVWADTKVRPESWHDEDLRADLGAAAWSEVYTFHYMCQPSGEAQHVATTLRRERVTSVHRVLGIPTRRRVEHAIDIRFHEEVGNQRGSWKGGAVGCHATMRPGETPGETLRRFQRDRANGGFDR